MTDAISFQHKRVGSAFTPRIPTDLDMLLFSVVVPNYNYGQYLEDCLESLAAQSLDVRCFEVLLVDDGSTDDSLACAARWAKARPHWPLRVIAGAHLGHPGAVRNCGAREAKAPWLLCLDSDDLLEPGSLVAFADAIAAHNNAAPVMLAPDCREWRGQEQRLVPVPSFDANLVRRQHPCSHALCYPTILWRALGGYDENNAYEDWDFLLRAVAHGAAWQGVPEAVHVYRMHEGSVSEAAHKRDAVAKADMVLRSAHFFDPTVVWWARQVRDGVPWMIPFPRGIIPSAENMHQWYAQCVATLGNEATRFFPVQIFARPVCPICPSLPDRKMRQPCRALKGR